MINDNIMRKLVLLLLLPLLAAPDHLSAQSWDHVGPFSTTTTSAKFETGRMNRLRPHPGYNNTTNRTVYGISNAGGLWVSNDDAANWSNINTDFMKYSGVADAGIDATNNILYVADFNGPTNLRFGRFKGYHSSGVYKYFPSSDSWTTTGSIPYSTATAFNINSVYVHPSAPQVIFICTSQGVFRSSNSGTSWTQVFSGAACEDLVFIPRNNGTSGAYPYLVYVSGFETFLYSSDDGNSFTTVSSIMTEYALVDDEYAATCYIHDAVTDDDIIFIWAFARDAANPCGSDIRNYILYRYVYNQTSGSQTCTRLEQLTAGCDEYDVTPARLCVGSNAPFSVWFGGVDLYHYNINTGVRTTLGAAHDDQHDISVLPAYNKFFSVNDGGIRLFTYTALNSPDNGVYSFSSAIKNIGLHVANVWGFSSSEQEPDVFMTAEVDHAGFSGVLYNSTLLSGYVRTGGHEAPGAHIDVSDKNLMFARSSAYGDGYIISTDHYATTSSGIATLPSVSDPCVSAGTALEGMDFERNSFFQDPYRPYRIFYGGIGLYTYCKNLKKFTGKFRPNLVFASTGNPVKDITWNQNVTAMGFSIQDKNKVYVSVTNHGSLTNAGQLLVHTGSDFDDSWWGHNENNWTNITPDYNSLPFVTTPLSYPNDFYKTWFTGIAVSELNPNRVFAGCFEIPNNPTIKVMKYESGTWTNYSTGIPVDEFPTSMVYERGSNDGVFVGTNRAVYYRNATMSSWVLHSNNLPHVPVSQLDLNYQDNTVRAATFGRGVWRCALPCPPDVSLTLNGLTYSTNTFKEASQFITSSNTTVNGGDVRFRAGTYVDLLPTFTATSSSGTSFFAYIHGCNTPGSTMKKPSALADPEITERSVEIDPTIADNVSVAPNPSAGIFNIFRNTDEPTSIIIYDINGRVVFTAQDISGLQTQVDLSGQPRGMYIVKSVTGQKVSVARILLQ